MRNIKKMILSGAMMLTVLGASLVPTSTAFARSYRNTNTNVSRLTPKAIREIVMKEARSGKIVDIEFDIDDGFAIYEVKVLDNGREKTYELDAYSGIIVDFESERMDDRKDYELYVANPKLSMDDIEALIASKYSGTFVEDIELDFYARELAYKVNYITKEGYRSIVLSANNGVELNYRYR